MNSVVVLRPSIMDKENLNFKINVSGTYWDKKPEFSISLDGVTVHRGSISEGINVKQTISFVANITEDEKHLLVISLHNKEDSDTVQNEDKTEIIKDMLLNVEDVYIDDISIGTLKWTHSKYISNNNEYSNMVNLGWNGDWVLEFESPFYLWLLENT